MSIGAIMKPLLGINWRTSVGAIVPILTAITLISKAIIGREWPDNEHMAIITSALSLAWTSIFAKDKDVTGGTVSNVDGTVAKPVSLIEGGKVV